jgi:hypothetical protein
MPFSRRNCRAIVWRGSVIYSVTGIVRELIFNQTAEKRITSIEYHGGERLNPMRHRNHSRRLAQLLTRVVCVSIIVLGLASSSSAAGIKLWHLTGAVYVVEDSNYSSENSLVYIGERGVTVIGATWTTETAKLLADDIRTVTKNPIIEVINTNYHPDRCGGNAYWKSIGCTLHSTQMTYDLLKTDWASVVNWTRAALPS